MKFLFLLYVSRSGSTMLANKLAEHLPGMLVFPELDVITDLFAIGDKGVRETSVATLTEIFERDRKYRALGIDDDVLACALRTVAQGGISSILEALTQAYAASKSMRSVECVLFQRGSLSTVAATIAQTLPNSLFIHIYRDPRGAISSVTGLSSKNLGQFELANMGRRDTLGLARNWRAYVGRADSFCAVNQSRALTIRYEDFCREYPRGVEVVASFLGVKYSKKKQGRLVVADIEREIHININRPPILNRLEAWKDELEPWRGYLVENLCGTMMARMGYAPYFSQGMDLFSKSAAWIHGISEYVPSLALPTVYWATMLIRKPSVFRGIVKIRIQRQFNRMKG